jgi:Bacterial Ig domain/Bacterial Ig-like domain
MQAVLMHLLVLAALTIAAVAPASAQLLPPPPSGSLIVTLTSPGQGSTVQGTVPVSASVSVVGSLTVSRVDFFADGNFIGVDAAAPYSMSWNTRNVGNGSHTLRAVAQDALGVRWTSNAVSITVANDITRPTVTINQAAGQADPASASPISFSIVFSEPVSGFTGADVTIGGTAAGTKTVTVTGGPSTYNAAVSGMTDGTVTATIGAGVAQDAAGNANTASTSTDNSVTFKAPDTTAPTVTINQAAGQADSASASPINFTIVFSEPVSGFTGADVTIGGTAGGTKTVTITGSGSTYNAAVSGMTTAGTVSATIAAGVATDAANNANTASSSTDNTVTWTPPDTTAPTVTINQAATQADPASASPINFAVVFSEPVSGFTGADVTIGGTAGGTKTVTITGSGSTYNAAVSGMTTAGTVSATIAAGVATDAANNVNTASSSTDNTVTFQTDAPPTGTRVEAEDNRAGFGGTAWRECGPEVANFSGGIAGCSDVKGDTYTLTFTGTAVSWLGLKCSVCGIASVSIDGGAPATVDTAGPGAPGSGLTSEALFSISGLDPAVSHTMVITVTSTSNSGGAFIVVDAFDVSGSTTGSVAARFEEDSPAISVSPTDAWVRRGPDVASFSGRTAGSSDVAGTTVTVTFTGTAVSWIGLRCSVCGIATVSIDGGPATSIDTTGPAAPGTPGLTSEAVFTASNLTAGSHTMVITVTGSTTAGGAHIIVDAFDVTVGTGSTVNRIEENNPAVSVTGAWVLRGAETAAFSGSSAGSSHETGATATITFTGTAVSWIGLRCSACGIASVSIDGGATTSVDTVGRSAPGSPGLASEVVFTVSGLAPGSHTMVITVTGGTTSGGAHVIVDAVDVTP